MSTALIVLGHGSRDPRETARAQAALDAATASARAAVLSTGDAGIYGMAGQVLELLLEGSGVEVEVVKGVTAASAMTGVRDGRMVTSRGYRL
jgi:precorrin-3B methylase